MLAGEQMTCSSYCVHTMKDAIFQGVHILLANHYVHKSPSLEDNSDTTIRYCVPTARAGGIRFQLVAACVLDGDVTRRDNHVWEGGSYITVFGVYGNIVQKTHYFEDKSNEFVITCTPPLDLLLPSTESRREGSAVESSCVLQRGSSLDSALL